MLGNSQVVIKFLHSCKITILQTKNYKRRKNNLEIYIAPFPWLIIMNVPNLFGEFGISRNTDEFSRQYSGLKNFLHPQVSAHPHEISSHYNIISTKYTNVSVVKLLRFGFKYGTRLVIYTRTKKVYISSCGHKSFDLQWVYLKSHWKITTLCVQHHIWLPTLNNVPSKCFLQVAHSKIHQTWLYLKGFWLGLFILYGSKIYYKWMSCIFYYRQINEINNNWFPKHQLVCFS